MNTITLDEAYAAYCAPRQHGFVCIAACDFMTFGEYVDGLKKKYRIL